MLTTKQASLAAPAATSSRDISVAGGSLFVQVTGRGVPLLLIHGWPLDHRLFSRQEGPLGEKFRVITYDRRGFGKSTAPPDMRAELDDIDVLLDALGEKSAHILGMSQGGRIALRYAATRPERVRSLILQGAVVDGLDIEEHPDERIPVAEYAELAATGHLELVKSRWLAHPMMHLEPSDHDASRLVAGILDDYEGRDLLDFDADSYEFDIDILDRLAEFDRPVLIITGANETETRHAHAAEILRRVPRGEETTLHHSGHLANVTEPSKYNQAVENFIRYSEAQSQQ